MKPVELIKTSVANTLIQDGYSDGIATRYAQDAANHYSNAQSFKNGAYADCLAFARKQAKMGVAK